MGLSNYQQLPEKWQGFECHTFNGNNHSGGRICCLWLNQKFNCRKLKRVLKRIELDFWFLIRFSRLLEMQRLQSSCRIYGGLRFHQAKTSLSCGYLSQSVSHSNHFNDRTQHGCCSFSDCWNLVETQTWPICRDSQHWMPQGRKSKFCKVRPNESR